MKDVDTRDTHLPDRSRRRSRRLLIAAVVLLALGVAFDLFLVEAYRWERASAIVQVTSLPIALVSLLLAGLSVRGGSPRGADEPTSLGQVADQLATAVQSQWDAELNIHGFHGHRFLAVRWSAVVSELTDDWDSLRKLATTWPSERRSDEHGWAASPTHIHGSDGELALCLTQAVPTARVMVLGAAGSGKSVLLIRTLLELIASRREGGSVPVLLSVASWDPVELSFSSWIEKQLIRDYPGLGEPAPGVGLATTRAADLLRQRKLILLLDGLDEMASGAGGRALSMINDSLLPGQAVVVSSRTSQEDDRYDPMAGSGERLAACVVVRLIDVSAAAVSEYLNEVSRTKVSRERWDPVVAALTWEGPLSEALRTPLMVSLARAVYNPQFGETSGRIPDPGELCDDKRFDTAEKIRQHLFDLFVPAAYRRSTRWSVPEAERWLRLLAEHLNEPGPSDIRWWEFRQAAPRRLSGVVAGLAAGGVAGVTAAFSGHELGAGIGAGLLGGMAIALLIRRTMGAIGSVNASFAVAVLGASIGGQLAVLASQGVWGSTPSATVSLVGGVEAGLAVAPVGRLVGGFLGGAVGGALVTIFAGHGSGLVFGLVDGIAVAVIVAVTVELEGRRSPSKGLSGLRWNPLGSLAGIGVGLVIGTNAGLSPTGLVLWAVAGLATGTVAGLAGSAADLTQASSPAATLRRDRNGFLITGVATALALGLTVGLGITPAIGIAAGLCYGVTFSFLQAAWGSMAVTRLWMWMTGRTPLRLMTFLADAHENREILRQVGSVYQFRHAELQRSLEVSSPAPVHQEGAAAVPWINAEV
ncbi:hypothetical protein GCM10022223_31700 [Kineosporia mesophila]|uniref:NACHT domain-containing protein n=2 Tax=Kineosporia mesophila TaxID=566012 RepID=A0ABP6ZND7_9ACTN